MKKLVLTLALTSGFVAPAFADEGSSTDLPLVEVVELGTSGLGLEAETLLAAGFAIAVIGGIALTASDSSD